MHVAAILKVKGRNVVTTTADKSLLDVAKLLEQRDIGCIVIEADEGQVAGIVSERDVVRAVAADVGNDGAPVPPHASGRERPLNRPRLHWRCGQDAHRGSRHGGGGDEGVRSIVWLLTKHPG